MYSEKLRKRAAVDAMVHAHLYSSRDEPGSTERTLDALAVALSHENEMLRAQLMQALSRQTVKYIGLAAETGSQPQEWSH